MAKRKGEQKALKAQKAAEAGEPATRDVSALEQKKCWAKVEMWFKSTPCAVNAKTTNALTSSACRLDAVAEPAQLPNLYRNAPPP
eukprot:CAMPEP_0202780818 /NCGR_PEP_ID=MMETSP1388-20130828/59448_1 /ASSEMBLY_ACC=CAM_ASM_000864 /TAXON_ID=37098 /ORGANISM="Isochrysis sp, Strain CCMP1244" /LENGTH=84 /DNA_ID=CAMNT_0049450205 /DNA_START=18 /DNA_END=273 /DNA_ORIENTATION=+